jgi:hypothetical protein
MADVGKLVERLRAKRTLPGGIVQTLNPDGDLAAATLLAQADEITTLRQQVGEAREALEPFAARAETPGFALAPNHGPVTFFASDVRRARTVHSTLGGERG